jgi:hypothetical protein
VALAVADDYCWFVLCRRSMASDFTPKTVASLLGCNPINSVTLRKSSDTLRSKSIIESTGEEAER